MAPNTPLPYRLRSEIQWTAVQGRHRQWWVAKDPLRSNLFRCDDEVRRLLQLLNGQRSLEDLNGLLKQIASMRRISLSMIQRIIASAIQKQLLIRSVHPDELPIKIVASNSSPQVSLLGSWLRSVQRWPWLLVQGKWRFGNPEWMANGLAKRTDWLFGASAVSFWLVFICMSLGLVLAKAAKQSIFLWPSVDSIASDTVSLLIILLLTRVMHEFGHAISCVRMGARCREFGVFFMLGVACPYVDVTDSWRLQSPRARMASTAAGVYVEWIIAAVAGLVWYASQPCWLHSVAWQVMVICSLTTLLINANPLMRYDGYFLLSDLLEVVNLREEAEAALGRFVRRWCLSESIAAEEPRWSWRDSGFVLYACSSWIYRSALIFALIWSVLAICSRWQLPKLGWSFAILALVSFFLIPIGQKMFQSWSAAQRAAKGHYRLAALWLGLIALILNLGSLPLPHRIACVGSIQPENRTFVYTQTAGRIPRAANQASSQGTNASFESPLVCLENPWIEDQARIAIQHERQLECQLTAMRKTAYQESSMIDRIPTLEMLVSIAKKQSQNAFNEVNALTIQKPSAGSWIPIKLPPLDLLDGTRPSLLNYTVVDSESRGQWLPAGTPIGYLASTDGISIAANVPVSQLNNIQIGMLARVRFDQVPDRVYSARVVEISEMTSVSDEFSSCRTKNHSSGGSDSSNSGSLVSILLTVDDQSQKTLAMDGTAEVVLWSTPKSLFHLAFQLAGTTFGPSGSQTTSR